MKNEILGYRVVLLLSLNLVLIWGSYAQSYRAFGDSRLSFILQASHQSYAQSVWRQKSVSYFAYGSNINPAVLEDLRDIKPLASLPGLVRGYRLAFNLIGLPLVSPASASAEPSEGDELHGVLFTLSRNAICHLCGFLSAMHRCSRKKRYLFCPA
jgi:hypothetical protein